MISVDFTLTQHENKFSSQDIFFKLEFRRKRGNLKLQSVERTLLQCKCRNHGAGLFTCLASLHAQPVR